MAKQRSQGPFVKAGRRALHRRYEVAAEAGDTEAMIFLATNRAPEDPGGRGRWFRRAAEAGNVPRDVHRRPVTSSHMRPRLAMWLERAAEDGHQDALVKLGVQAQQAGERDARASSMSSGRGRQHARDVQPRPAARGPSRKVARAGTRKPSRRATLRRCSTSAVSAVEAPDPAGARALWERAAAGGQAGRPQREAAANLKLRLAAAVAVAPLRHRGSSRGRSA